MFSIVTQSYNQCQFIAQTIDSVLKQSISANYTIVDGGSTDGTINILHEYSGYVNNIIIGQDNGQADAIIKGFLYSNGEICSYINSDDFFLSGTLAYVEEYFAKHPDIDVIYGHRLFVNEHGKPIKLWILPPHSDYLMSRWDFIPQETCFWRRKLMDKVGGIDKLYHFALDYDFFARMMKEGKFVRVNRFLAAFRDHPSSKTSTQILTVGAKEIEMVRHTQGISINSYENFVGRTLSFGIRSVSSLTWIIFKKYLMRRISL